MISNGKKPAIAMFGGSLFLFPHPVKNWLVLCTTIAFTSIMTELM
jgi:hypothetical protein